MQFRFALAWAVITLTALPAQGEVLLGIDSLAADGFRQLHGKRVGLLTNQSGVNRRGESTIDLLRQAPNVKLVALYAPEHGLDGKARAGRHIASGRDPRTGLPVHSLYGSTRKPTPEMLKDIEVMVYDLQDTGVRSYTYISTMGLAMESCAEAGVEFIVLDRPNPLGGFRSEGPPVTPDYRSFVSQWFIPYAYGMTCAELARMINQEGWIKKPCRLTVVPMRGWIRSMVWADTGLRWVPTSPNIPLDDSVLGYAALGLLGEMAGGSGLSIGGIINRPFQCVLAPWIDGKKLSHQLSRYELPGVRFPVFYTTHNNKKYQGVRLEFDAPLTAPLVSINFYMLDAIRSVHGRDLLAEATRAGQSFGLFDKAIGSSNVRKRLLAGATAVELVNSWSDYEEAFELKRRPYLLYAEDAGGRPRVTPFPGKESHTSPAKGFRTVTVARGDTVYRIARDFGVSISDIAEANPGLNVSRIYLGQKLKVPRR